MKSKIQNSKSTVASRSLWARVFHTSLLILVVLISVGIQYTYAAGIQTPASDITTINPNNSAFRLTVCDGPRLPDSLKTKAEADLGRNYVPCDFNGLMLQVQHLINIMLVLGVLVATGLFTWAGALMITGDPSKMNKARAIFPKVFLGFIIMLSAWFIVYQLIDWLARDNGFKTLLGSP